MNARVNLNEADITGDIHASKSCMNEFLSVKALKPQACRKSSIPAMLDSFRQRKHLPLEQKNAAPLVNFCQYSSGEGRKKQHIEAQTAIVLDIDHALTAAQTDELLATVEQSGKASVVYTTHSSREGAYKLRVILLLEHPLSLAEFEAEQVPLRAAKWLDVPIDPSCCNAGQLYYLPSCPAAQSEHHAFIAVSDADAGWSLDDLPELEEGDAAALLEPRRSTTGKRRKTVSEDEPSQLLDDLVSQCFSGVEPIYCESKFHIYRDGCWLSMTSQAMQQYLYRDVFRGRCKLVETNGLIDIMKVQYYHETFPAAGKPLDDGTGRRHLICVGNGTVDPMQMQLIDHAPHYHLRSRMAYDFDPDATCPQWLAFLEQVFRDDSDRDAKINFLQQWMGWLLIPCTKYQLMLWLYGQGANGKSVLLDVTTALLGQGNVSAVAIERLGDRFQLAELRGKLANLCDEMAVAGTLRDDLLKQLVAGNRVQGEEKNQTPYYFSPYARFVIGMNNLPRLRDTSHGFFRRIRVLTFNRKFDDKEQDRDLPQRLKAELAGIFVWALRGLQQLLAQGDFIKVPSSTAALEQYREECNPVALFVRDLVQRNDEAAADSRGRFPKVLVHDVYQRYQAYCRAKGFAPMNDARFGREMAAQGFRAVASSGKRYYPLQLRDPAQVGINGLNLPPLGEQAVGDMSRFVGEDDASA